MKDRDEKIKQLNELGYETKVEDGTLFIYKEVWEDDAEDKTIYALMSDYRHSYGVRPKKEVNGNDKTIKENN